MEVGAFILKRQADAWDMSVSDVLALFCVSPWPSNGHKITKQVQEQAYRTTISNPTDPTYVPFSFAFESFLI